MPTVQHFLLTFYVLGFGVSKTFIQKYTAIRYPRKQTANSFAYTVQAVLSFGNRDSE